MRRRKVKGALERLLSYENYVFCGNAFNLDILNEKKGNRNEVLIELGMGRGKFIIENALKNPDKFYVGIEVKEEVLLRAVENPMMNAIDNLIFIWGNVDRIEDYFMENTIDHIFINFCDPWPKKRWSKRRLTSKNYLKKYLKILKGDGQIHFKTDSEKLFEFSLNEFLEFGFDVRNVSFDLHGMDQEIVTTEYEDKFVKSGLKIYKMEGINNNRVDNDM